MSSVMSGQESSRNSTKHENEPVRRRRASAGERKWSDGLATRRVVARCRPALAPRGGGRPVVRRGRAGAATELRAAALAARLAPAARGVAAAPEGEAGEGDGDRALAGGRARARRAPERGRPAPHDRGRRPAEPDV